MSQSEEMSFEAAYTQLEGCIRKLDEGGLTIDEALSCYEEASALVNRCRDLLDRAELRLRQVDDSGAPTEP